MTTDFLSGSNGEMPAEIDDIEAYIAGFDDRERDALAADAAIDVAILLHRARERRGLSQTAAAALVGLRQQTVSRLEQPAVNPHLGTIQSYVSALGYELVFRVIDLASGETVDDAILVPPALR